MSIEEITKKVYRCTCELPDCCGIDPETGKPRPWDSKDGRIPERCSWCKSRRWNGQNRRSQSSQYKWVRTKQCIVCGGTEWKKNAEGYDVCANCRSDGIREFAGFLPKKIRKRSAASARPTVNLPKPTKVRPAETE